MNLKLLKEAILSILYPRSLFCISCGKQISGISKRGVCGLCYESLPFIGQTSCISCGRPIEDSDEKCVECKRHGYCFDKGISVFEYSQSIQQLIHRFKYYNQYYLSSSLGYLMYEAYKERGGWRVDVIIPVPLHPKREKSRGYNQSALLADSVSCFLGINNREEVLIRKIDTPTQTRLSGAERRKNLTDAFEVADCKSIEGKCILLIDDVFTTGATADICSRVLKEAGARKVYILTLASVPAHEKFYKKY